jgi:phosphatidylinositol alpha-1,6-mannosyltransferase
VPSSPRVLLAADSLLAGANGIARVARLSAKVLAEQAGRRELQVRAITLRDSTAPDLGLPVTPCRSSRARFVFECQRAALSCTHFVYDFAGMARAHPHWMRPRRRSLVWVHGIEVWEHARPDRLHALARADELVTNTEYTRVRAESLHGGFAHARTCWLGTESDDLPPELDGGGGTASNVLLLGRINPGGGEEKGHREMIECWPAVVRAIPDARLLFAGGGPAESLVRAWVANSPVRDRIEVLGFVPEVQLPALWSRTSVLAMPARGEGLGLAYLEAMRQGIAVIASVHDAAPEINLHGVTGYNVDLDRPGDLALRLIELLRDRALRERMGHAGRERWRSHFAYSAFRARFQPILHSFLARR